MLNLQVGKKNKAVCGHFRLVEERATIILNVQRVNKVSLSLVMYKQYKNLKIFNGLYLNHIEKILPKKFTFSRPHIQVKLVIINQ